MKLVLFSSTDVYLHRPIEFEVPLDGCRSYFSLHHTIRQKIVALKRSAPDIRRLSGIYKGALDDEFGSSNIARAQTFPDPFGGVDVGSYTLFEVDGARLTTHASIFTRISAGSSRHHHKEKLMLIVSDSESLPLAVGGQVKGAASATSRLVAPRRDDRAEKLLSLSAAHRRQSAYESVESLSDSSPTSTTNSSTTQSSALSSPETPPRAHRRASFKPSDSGRSAKSTTVTADQYVPPSPVLASGGGSPGYFNSHHREPLPPFRQGYLLDRPDDAPITNTKGLNSSTGRSAVAGQLTYETSDADGDAPPTPRSSLYAPSSRAALSHYAPPSSIGRNTSTGIAPSSRLQLSSALEGLSGREQRDISRRIPEGLHVATKSAVFYFNTNNKEHDHPHDANKSGRVVSHSNRGTPAHGDSSKASSRRQSEVGLVHPPSRLLLADYRGGRVPQYTPVISSPPSRRSPPRGPKQVVAAEPARIAFDPSRLQGTPQRAVMAPLPLPQPEVVMDDEDVAFADEVSDGEEVVQPPVDPRYQSVESSANVSLIGGAHTQARSALAISRSILPPPMDDGPTTPSQGSISHLPQQTSPSPLPSSHISNESYSVPRTYSTGAVVLSRRDSHTTVATSSRRQPIMAPSPTISSAPQLNNAPTFYNTPNINITIRMPSPNDRRDLDRSIRVDTGHTNNSAPMAPIGGVRHPSGNNGRYQDPMSISIDRVGTTTHTNNNSRRWASIEDEDAVVYNSQDMASHRRLHLISPPSAHVDTAPIPPTPQSTYVDVTPSSPPRQLDAASLYHPHSPSGMAQLRSPVETASSPVQATGGGGIIRSPSGPAADMEVPDPVPIIVEDRASLDVSKVTGTTNGPSTPFNLTGEPVGPKGVPIVKSIPPVTSSTPQDSAAEEREDANMFAALPPVFKHTPYQRRPTPQRSTPNSSFRGSRQSSPMRRSAHVSWSIGTAPLWGKDTRFRSIAAYTDVLNTHREEEYRDLALARDDGAARFVHHLNRVLPDRLDKHATAHDEAVPRSTWSPTRTRTSPSKSNQDRSSNQHQQPNVQAPPILFRNILGYYVGLAWDGWRLQDQHAARNAQLSGGASMTPIETRGRCGLLITGPPGSGKTTTMGVVVRDLILPEICNLVRFNQHVKEQSQSHRGSLEDAALLVPPFLLPLAIKKLLPADSNPTATVIQLALDEGTEKWMPSKLWSREAFATFDAELFASRFIHEAVDCLIREPGYADRDSPVESNSSRAFSNQHYPNRRLDLDSASNSHNSSSLLTQGRHATHVDLCQQLTTVLRRAVTSSSEFQRMDSSSNIVFLRNDRSFLQQYLERSVAAVYIRTGVGLNTDKIETEARHLLNEWVLVMAELQSALGNLASVVRGEKAKAETGGSSRRSSPVSRPPPSIPAALGSRSRSEIRQGPPHVPQGRPPPHRASPGRPPMPPHTRPAESIDVTRMGDSFEASTSLPTVDDIRTRRRPTTPADALREVINVLFGPLLDLLVAEAHRQQHPRQANKGVMPSILVLCDDIDSLYATGHTSVIGDALVAQFTSVSGAAVAKSSQHGVSPPSLSTQLGSSRMLIGSWTDRKNNVLRRGEDGSSRRTTPRRSGTPNRASTPHGWGIPSAVHAHQIPSLPLNRPSSTPRTSPQAPGVGNQLVTVFNMLGAVPLVDLATEYPTLPSQMVCRPTTPEDPSSLMDPMHDRKSLLSGLSINSTFMAGNASGKQQPYPLVLNDGSEVFDVSMFKGAPGYLCKYAELAAVLMTRTGDDKDDFLTSYLEQENAHLAEIRQPHGSRPARLLSPTCALEVRHVGVHRILQSLAKLVGADGRVSVDTMDTEMAHLYDY